MKKEKRNERDIFRGKREAENVKSKLETGRCEDSRSDTTLR